MLFDVLSNSLVDLLFVRQLDRTLTRGLFGPLIVPPFIALEVAFVSQSCAPSSHYEPRRGMTNAAA